jgi:hypothetical protein
VEINRHASTVEADGDAALGDVDIHAEGVHRRVVLLVLGSIHEDVVEDLVKPWFVGDQASPK